MNDARIKQAVLEVMDRTDFVGRLASAVGDVVASSDERAAVPALATPTPGTQKLLTRIVLGDILDDTILGARPQDRTFPLRLFFSELSTLLASNAEDGAGAHAAEQAFTLASGLNFFFRGEMDGESKIRIGLEVSRQLYTLALGTSPPSLDADVVGKAAPLLATLMSTELERVRFESVDHAKVFDSQVHERTTSSDPTGSRIVRPASFLCRVTSNNTVKAKAQVVT